MQRRQRRVQALRRGPDRPHAAAATISDMARGATFAVTEMTPRAPASSASRAVASSPLRIVKPAPHDAQQLAHALDARHAFFQRRRSAETA